jgi:hypothetical protein
LRELLAEEQHERRLDERERLLAQQEGHIGGLVDHLARDGDALLAIDSRNRSCRRERRTFSSRKTTGHNLVCRCASRAGPSSRFPSMRRVSIASWPVSPLKEGAVAARLGFAALSSRRLSSVGELIAALPRKVDGWNLGLVLCVVLAPPADGLDAFGELAALDGQCDIPTLPRPCPSGKRSMASPMLTRARLASNSRS